MGQELCTGDGSRAHGGHPALPAVTEPRCRSCLQGTCQWVTLDFPRTVKVSQLHIQFQGGFSSRLCTLEGKELVWGCGGPSASVYSHLDPAAVCCKAQRYLLAIPQTPEGLRPWAGAEKGWIARIRGSPGRFGCRWEPGPLDRPLLLALQRIRDGAAEAVADVGGSPAPEPPCGCLHLRPPQAAEQAKDW